MKEKFTHVIKSEITWEVLFLGFLFCFYMSWARLMPLDSCPDESMRYDVAKYIYENGRLPHGGDPAIRNSLWGISYGFNPILSYMAGALFMKITSLVTTDPSWLVLAARMVSVLCGMGAAWFTIRIGKKLFTGTKRILFVFLVTLLPGVVFVYAYVNTDSLALFSIAVIIYMWICGMETQWNLKYCVGLAVGISLCALSYYNAYGIILCSILFFGLSVLFCFRKQWDYQSLLKKGILISAIVLVLIGWWFVRNYVIYDGDLLGMRTSSYYGELYGQEGMKPSQRVTPRMAGISLWEMITKGYITEGSWWYLTSSSFIGWFGQLDIPIPDVITQPYRWMLGLGLLGMLIHFVPAFSIRRDKKWQIRGIFNWCMLLAMIIPAALSLSYSYTSDYQSQGRYCLPMLLPLAYFVTVGYGNLLGACVKNKKAREISYGMLGIAALVVVLYVYKTIIRFLYLPNPLIKL